MKLPLSCGCGTVQGEVDLDRAWARVTCYCRDCQSFARFLGDAASLDACGGTDIVPMAPDAVRFSAGLEHVACMSLGPNGLLRWYARCCRTPLANLPRDPRMFYVGLVAQCLQDLPAGSLEHAVGPPGRVAVQTASATAPVPASRWRQLFGVLRIAWPVLLAWLRRRRIGAPFLDAQGQPLRLPETISREQRQALRLPLA